MVKKIKKKNKVNEYKVNINYNNGFYIARFYYKNELVQVISSLHKNKLESLKRKFYNGKLIFNQPPETRPMYVNKIIYL